MNATTKAILIQGRTDVEAPEGVREFIDFRSDLIHALVEMPVEDRIEATKNLARYVARNWKGKDALRGLLVIERYGATQAFREIVRRVVATDAWSEFAKAYVGFVDFAVIG